MFCRVLLMGFLSLTCAGAGAMPKESPANGAPGARALAGRVIELAAHAQALEGNRLGDPTVRRGAVMDAVPFFTRTLDGAGAGTRPGRLAVGSG